MLIAMLPAYATMMMQPDDVVYVLYTAFKCHRLFKNGIGEYDQLLVLGNRTGFFTGLCVHISHTGGIHV